MVFLTGAFGLLGQAVVRECVQRQIPVTCFDMKTKKNLETYNQLVHELGEKGFTVVWGDLTKPEGLKELLANHEAVIHLAAIIPPMAYTLQPEIVEKVNVGATANLLQCMNPQARFVYASSYSVMGTHSPDSTALLDGSSPTDPQDIYAKHKIQSEALVKQHPGQWSILRLGAIAPSHVERLPPSHQATCLIFGVPANQRRHGVHSRDAAAAFVECAVTTNKAVHGKILMIGGDKSWQVLASDFFNVIFSIMGMGNLDPRVFRVASRPEAYYYEHWMDTTESQALLKFQTRSFSDWKRELAENVGWLQYSITCVLAPVVRAYLCRQSPHWKYNVHGQVDPSSTMTFVEWLAADEAR